MTTEQREEGAKPEPDPVAERQQIAFTTESLAWQDAMGADYTAFLEQQVGFLGRQYDWARERCVQLNAEVQRITEETESLKAQVAAYQLSAAIDAEAGEPEGEDPVT